MVFAFTIETPEREAIITTAFDGVDISWPITTEAKAYELARRVGAPGFWRLKVRKPAKHAMEPNS